MNVVGREMKEEGRPTTMASVVVGISVKLRVKSFIAAGKLAVLTTQWASKSVATHE
jgi:hypothetical protein